MRQLSSEDSLFSLMTGDTSSDWSIIARPGDDTTAMSGSMAETYLMIGQVKTGLGSRMST